MGPPSRVALVVQRYGPEVNGGAEQLARRVARLLAGDLDLTVLTTCALDYRTWANHYPAGEQDVEGVRVRALPGGARARRRRLRRPLAPGPTRRPHDAALGAALDGRPGPGRARPGRAPARRGRRLRRGGLRHLPLPHDGGRASAWCATARCWCRRCTTSRRRGWRSSAGSSTPRAPSSSPTEEERELARERFGVGDDRARVAGWGLDPAAAVRPGAHGARSASRGPTRSASGGSTSRRASATSSSTTRATGGPCPDGLDLVLVGRRRRAAPRPPVAAPAGLRRGRRSSTTRSPARPSSCCRRRTRACRSCSSRRGPTGGRRWRTPPRRCWWASRAARAAASGTATATSTRRCSTCWRRARPLADAIGRQGRRWVAETCSWDRVRAVWLDALALAAGRARPVGGALMARPQHLRARPAALRLSPASPSPGCSTTAGAGSASRRIPLGLCVLVTLLYPLGALMPGSRAAPVALGDRRRRRSRSPRRLRLRGRRPGRRLATLVARAAADLGRGGGARRRARSPGCCSWSPTIEQGFATTIAVTQQRRLGLRDPGGLDQGPPASRATSPRTSPSR